MKIVFLVAVISATRVSSISGFGRTFLCYNTKLSQDSHPVFCDPRFSLPLISLYHSASRIGAGLRYLDANLSHAT